MIRVWIVEDSPSYRDAVAEEINSGDGMCCDGEFSSCEGLFERLQKDPPPDVILLDIGLPGLSGIEALATVKARASKSQVMMLTMFDDPDRIFKAVCAGASGYLLKSSDEDIPDSIRQVVSGGVALSPTIARSVLSLFARLGPVPEDYHLSPREQSVLELMARGQIKKEIATQLQLSYFTVDNHIKNIYRKLHVNNATAAVAKAIREGLY